MLEGTQRRCPGIPEVKLVNGSEIGIWGGAASGDVERVGAVAEPRARLWR